jgi:SAM-dependent methyltransferase
MDTYFETNLKRWDELVGVHKDTPYYDLAGFKAGHDSVHSIEVGELGDVAGKTLLHLQCHFGMDTLSWARRGATVTGVDFSERAIESASALASELEIDARFVHSDIYALPENLAGQFDIVFTSYGTNFWLPDLDRWAAVINHFLRPGGVFYIIDFHPMAGVFEEQSDVKDLTVAYPYFPAGPMFFEVEGTYADREATVQNRATYSWAHPIGETVTALLDAGLRLEFLHEFPFTTERWYPFMERGDDGYFRLTKHDGSVPLMYSIRARKPL